MSERAALIAAICANPDDDTPRLVFADWLDENEPDGGPRRRNTKAAPVSPSSWASLIRAECEFDRLQNDGSPGGAVYDFFAEFDDQTFEGVRWQRVLPEMTRRIELQATAKRVRAKSRNSLLGLMPRNAGVWSPFDTYRGFPDSVYITRPNRVDVTRLDQLPAFAIHFGYLTHESPALVQNLIADGLLRGARALVLPSARADLMPVLSASADAARIREFTLQGGANSAAVIAQSLASTAHWAGLRKLRLSPDDALEHEEATRLFGARHLHRLTQLHVQGDENWTRHTVQGLAAFTELRDLRLISCGLDDAAAECLADMPSLANLRTLNLTRNLITGAGASALLASPHLKNLTVLDFEDNGVRGLDRTALANAPEGGLRCLAVQGCRLTTQDITAITTSPRVSELLYFAVCDGALRNRLLPGWRKALATALRRCSVSRTMVFPPPGPRRSRTGPPRRKSTCCTSRGIDSPQKPRKRSQVARI